MVCAAVLRSDEVLSGSCIPGAGARRKTGWLGHVAGVCCNIMRLLHGKGLLLAVQPEAVAWDSNGVDVAAIVVRIDAVGMDGQRYPPRYWEKFHPRKYWGN